MENIKQRLIELMADFLDEESTIIDLAISEKYDPFTREKSALHIKMAEKAYDALIAGILNAKK